MIGGLLGGLVRRNEETGLNPLQNIAASMDALVMPKYRMGEQIRQAGVQRVAADRRNATIAEMQKRADAGDTVAQRYLQGIQSGALDMKTGFAGYLNEIAANERFAKQQAAAAARAGGKSDVVVVGKNLVNRQTGEVIYSAPDTPQAEGTITLADGTRIVLGKQTETQAKGMDFGARMQYANQVLENTEQMGTSLGNQLFSKLPLFGLEQAAVDPEFKVYDNARRTFVNSILRRESGASIADSEFESANQQYFPQPFDPPEVIAQKRKARELATQMMLMSSGPEATQYAIDQANMFAKTLNPLYGTQAYDEERKKLDAKKNQTTTTAPKSGGGSTVLKSF